MTKNVWSYLEQSAMLYPDKIAYDDTNRGITFNEVLKLARSGGTRLDQLIGKTKEPVAVFMDKSVESIVAFFSVLSSGNFYSPIDCQMPLGRIQVIFNILKPRVVIADAAHREIAESICTEDSIVVLYEEMITSESDEERLRVIQAAVTELDPMYLLFTSGSTGIPKGVIVNQRVVVNYMGWLSQTYGINQTDVFGNQAPFYFDVSVHDIYGAVFFGASMVILPRELFGFPVRLIELMNDKKITTCLWVPSAMGIVAELDALSYVKPEYLRHMMFAGEVLPRKKLDYWLAQLPDVVYANLYGPTETFVCTAYTYTGEEEPGQPLPIGRPINNSEALILGKDNQLVKPGETGELCMRGSCLAMGYYHNEEKTLQSFCQNPLHCRYPERIYHTGDLVRYNEQGQLIYVSRKDFQIKHMGYRIELGEIETAVNRCGGVKDCVCVYDFKRQKIVLFYDGEKLERNDLLAHLRNLVPAYMLPGKIVHMDTLPHNANEKIDRNRLAQEIG